MKTEKEFEESIKKHLKELPKGYIESLKRDYKDDTMVIMHDLLPEDIKQSIASEARQLLDKESERRELIVEQSGGTPRSYNSVGRDIIRKEGVYIPAFFDSKEILNFLSTIIGEKIHKVPYAPEEFIINSQSKRGDTHGWHWDDYTFALIWVVDEPDILSGGRVEFVPRIKWDKEKTRIQLYETLKNDEVRSIHVPEGSCYLLRARDALHRISPITKDTRRTVIVYTYATTEDLQDTSISHESMESIYPKDTKKEALA
tara:strand:+ start:179292 stop:180065 length:774 start_codon:yes stop_codon:yes gene_type:complete